MSRKRPLSKDKILELLIDTDNDELPDIEVDIPDPQDEDDVSEQEEIIYHDVDVLVEAEVTFFDSSVMSVSVIARQVTFVFENVTYIDLVP
jgi:hypothetical protein